MSVSDSTASSVPTTPSSTSTLVYSGTYTSFTPVAVTSAPLSAASSPASTPTPVTVPLPADSGAPTSTPAPTPAPAPVSVSPAPLPAASDAPVSASSPAPIPTPAPLPAASTTSETKENKIPIPSQKDVDIAAVKNICMSRMSRFEEWLAAVNQIRKSGTALCQEMAKKQNHLPNKIKDPLLEHVTELISVGALTSALEQLIGQLKDAHREVAQDVDTVYDMTPLEKQKFYTIRRLDLAIAAEKERKKKADEVKQQTEEEKHRLAEKIADILKKAAQEATPKEDSMDIVGSDDDMSEMEDIPANEVCSNCHHVH